MQRLANVAGRVATAVLMLVEIRATGGEIQKRDSGQQGQRATCVYLGENEAHESQSAFSVHFTVPRWRQDFPKRLLPPKHPARSPLDPETVIA